MPDSHNPFKEATYASAIGDLAARFGTREALVFRGERFTFADARRRIDEASRRFLALGLQPGERVALWLPNRPDFLWCWLGASQAGLVTVVLNSRLKLPEMSYQLGQSESAALVIPGEGSFRDFVGEVVELCPEIASQPGTLGTAAFPFLRHVVVLDDGRREPGLTRWAPFGREDGDEPEPLAVATDPSRPALISYSSGTTALPKGALITHCVWRKAWDIGIRADLSEADRLYLCIPLFGSMAMMNGVLPLWARGGAVVLDERFDAETFVRAVEAERCTAVHLLPPMIQALASLPADSRRRLATLRIGWVLSSERSILEMAAGPLGIPGVMTGYGLTETTTVLTRNRWDDPLETRITSQGYALPDIELRLVDPETGREVATGETGEIWARGYCITPGYFRKPAETARAITPEGWFRTGDAGTFDATGRLTFQGRLGDGYKSRGFNVSPAEIEAVLQQHPDVEVASVVGVDHSRWGQVGAAFVVAAPGRAPDPDELAAFLKPRLSSFKLPELIRVVAELPLTPGTGKVQKFRLREDAERLIGTVPARDPDPAPERQAARG